MIRVTPEQAADRVVGDFLAVDPSMTSAGVAYFRAGRLLAAARVQCPVTAELARESRADTRMLGARCLRMAHQIMAWCVATQHAEPRALVFEWPQVYTAGKSKGSPNDLLGLVGVGMATCGALASALGLQRNQAIEVHTPTPADWIGQIPKARQGKAAAASPRALRIASRLDTEETLILPLKSHDAIDAVGIGLWYLGRLDPARVYPGAS